MAKLEELKMELAENIFLEISLVCRSFAILSLYTQMITRRNQRRKSRIRKNICIFENI